MSIGLGNDIVVGRRMGVRLSGGGGSSLDADAATLIAAMTTTPDATRQGLINDLIVGLKTDGVWALLDELWVTAAHAEQAALLGWKRYKNLTAVNAPTFTVDQGFAGNGTTSYLNTNFVPSTDGVNFAQNDASYGVYSRTDNVVGAADIGIVRTSMHIRRAATFYGLCEVNGVSATNRIEGVNLASTGLYVARRTASNAIQMFRNGGSVGTGTQISAARSAQPMYICCENNGSGTPINFTTRQYAAAFVGAAMSEAQQLALYNRIQTYMTAVGANV